MSARKSQSSFCKTYVTTATRIADSHDASFTGGTEQLEIANAASPASPMPESSESLLSLLIDPFFEIEKIRQALVVNLCSRDRVLG